MTTADVVIVGAGTAGCVLAGRLSEDPRRRVVLVEAGGPSAGLPGRIPAAFPRLFRSPHDWALETDPEPAMDGRRMYWPRGRVIGGSGAMNAMLWVRGRREDYDGWYALGNPEWTWDSVLPWFRRAERHRAASGSHLGADGPLPIAALRHPSPLTTACIAAAAQAGLPTLEDLNDPGAVGFGPLHVTQRRGARVSTATAYLAPARRRANLVVRSRTLVTRLLLARGQAVGVEVAGPGGTERLFADQVVLAAGAVHSPVLLLRSGIGPATQLASHGIPVALDLPGVGANLQDHLATGIGVECARPVSLASAEGTGNLLRWLFWRGGPLTSTIAEAAGFIRSSAAELIPDLELVFAPSWFLDHGFANPPGHGMTLATVLLRPESRGRISLRGTALDAPPRIEARYLTAGGDLARMVRGLAWCREVLAQPALAPWRGAERLPGEAVRDAHGLAQHIRRTAQTLYHPVGTCRMGTDAEAVVDARLRVHGVASLTIADASVIPRITSGHTNAPTVMIAERAAAWLATR